MPNREKFLAAEGINDDALNFALTFEVDDFGAIASPGKFQGQALWVPYAYAVSLDGVEATAEEFDGSGSTTVVSISPGERALFGLAFMYKWFVIVESNLGFVYGELYDRGDSPESALSTFWIDDVQEVS